VFVVKAFNRVVFLIALVAFVIVGFVYWNMTWNERPKHSAANYPYVLKGGNLEINFNIGKSGVPVLVLAEIPQNQPAWNANTYVDSTMYTLRVAGNKLYIGHDGWLIRDEIKLPKETPWLVSALTKAYPKPIQMPDGGPTAYLFSDDPCSGEYAVGDYHVDEQLSELAVSGHLVVAAVDPDGFVDRVNSFEQIVRDH
jgi:hypothetical protein